MRIRLAPPPSRARLRNVRPPLLRPDPAADPTSRSARKSWPRSTPRSARTFSNAAARSPTRAVPAIFSSITRLLLLRLRRRPPPTSEPGPDEAGPAPPAPTPPPPAIALQFYGIATPSGAGDKKAFLTDGDEIIIAKEGEIIARFYKIIRIGVNSIELEDSRSQRRQSLPLLEE